MIAVLVGDGIGFTDAWIVIGLAGVAVSLLIVTMAIPLNRRIGEAAAENGPDSPEVPKALGRARVLNCVDILVFVVVVWAMVVKPGGWITRRPRK